MLEIGRKFPPFFPLCLPKPREEAKRLNFLLDASCLEFAGVFALMLEQAVPVELGSWSLVEARRGRGFVVKSVVGD